MKFTKEQLIAMGISESDADAITRQANENKESEKVVKVEMPKEITSITQLAEYAKGQIVKLPDFAPGQPFVARLKRPSMLVLVKSGKIPNSLLDTASSLFDGKSNANNADENTMGEMYDVLKIIAEASLVSPTMAEINNAGIELTDEQMIAIFNYSQQGVEGLKSFREE